MGVSSEVGVGPLAGVRASLSQPSRPRHMPGKVNNSFKSGAE